MKDVQDQLFIYDLNGTQLQKIVLPAIGSVDSVSGRKEDSELFIKFTSFGHPGTILRFDFPSNSSSTFLETCVKDLVPNDILVDQIFYLAKDGTTRIPMFIVRHKSVDLYSGNNPTLLYGYGGFNISIQPYFSVSWLFFMLHFKGVVVVANIRGGAEYGETWHHAGTLGQKQNVFDDFCLAAEYLVANKITTASLLTIAGGSNGGLLVGACILQRPELFGCAIAHVGVFDMLKFNKFTIGAAWMSDYGNPDHVDYF